MRTSTATRFARGAAGAAVLLTAVVAGVYAWRAWEARQARRAAPPVVPTSVNKRSESFSFSKVEGERTLFTVRASQATEFKEGGQSLLEDVWITIYGRAGQRFDNIHTRECDYQPASGRILCRGDVQIELESAEEARERPGQRVIRLRTSRVSFDRETGEAHTDQPVEFQFPYGSGRGSGLRYSTRAAIARLEQSVEVTLNPRPGAGAPLTFTGAALEFRRDARTMTLLAPVRAQQGNGTLTAGTLTLALDADMRGRRLTAADQPQFVSLDGRGESRLSARELAVLFHRDGYAERVLAAGDASCSTTSPRASDRITAQRMELEVADQGRNPGALLAAGNVRVTSSVAASGGASREVQSPELRMRFARAGRSAERRLERAESPAPSVVLWSEGEERTRLRAAKLDAEFAGGTRIRRLLGRGGVEIERRFGNAPPQQVASREFAVQFDPRGEWTEFAQTGDVRFREGSRAAQANRARAVRASELLALTGAAAVSDAVSRTTAADMAINQRTGEIVATGGVRTSYFAAGGARPAGSAAFVPAFGPQPAHITAAQVRALRDDGRATYTGQARLWQGDAVIESDAIEMRRWSDDAQLLARGNVRAVFPQKEERAAHRAAPTVWRARAGSLAYRSAAGLARLEERVFAESSAGQIESQRLDFFLGAQSGGAQRLERAEATGGVTVKQGTRRGTADRADYFASEGKFVLSGGKPALYDAALGATTGRQLTFFLADDRILVESEEGSRTVTKHRVEK
jgi:lipopolysaccharide export system protein LptA